MAWMIDPAHSRVEFTARHMMITNVRGTFEKVHGVVDFNEQDPTRSTLNVTIDAASINTRSADRDAHLRSADFLNAEVYPHLTFVGRRFEAVDGTHGRIVGDLTIRDVTREVVLDVEYTGTMRSPWGQQAAGFNARTQINRRDFGLTWNVALETGGVLVGDVIKIEIEVELIKQAEQAPEVATAAN
jgi:polyisoprenoid-binding protein YceI